MNQEDTIGRWSEDKLLLLRKYLHAYTTIMRTKPAIKEYFYVDAFAGTGQPRARDEERYINGSPRVALSLPHPFRRYLFIEMAPWRRQRLESLRAEFPDLTIEIHEGNCNAIILQEVTPRVRYEYYRRGLILLDPFGMQVEWSTIEQIAQTRALEVFLNFPVMALNRTVLANDPETLTETQIERMNRFWGSTDWRDDVYEEVPTLFGSREQKIRPTTGERLGALFRARLGEVFPYVTDPLVMHNSKNAPLYCLMLAGHNDKGAEIVGSIFKRYSRLGQ